MSALIISLNTAASDWLATMWRVCLQGSVALLCVWILCHLSPHTPARIRCWLWRMAAIKLLVAFFWVTPVLLPLLPVSPPAEAVIYYYSPVAIPAVESMPRVVSSAFPLFASSSAPVPSLACWLMLAWIVGLALLCRRVIREILRAQRLRSSCEPVRDPTLRATYLDLCRHMGIRWMPPLLSGEKVISPQLVGVWNPALLIPDWVQSDCGETEQQLLLAHELAHLKRKDLLWGWLPMLTQTLFFFNPLLWLARRHEQLTQEIACDEAAISSTGLPSASYALALVRLTEGYQQSSQAGLVSVGAMTNYRTLRARVIALRAFQHLSQKKLWVAASLVAAFGFVMIVPWQLVAQQRKEQEQAPIRLSDGRLVIPVNPFGEITPKEAQSRLTAAREAALSKASLRPTVAVTFESTSDPSKMNQEQAIRLAARVAGFPETSASLAVFGLATDTRIPWAKVEQLPAWQVTFGDITIRFRKRDGVVRSYDKITTLTVLLDDATGTVLRVASSAPPSGGLKAMRGYDIANALSGVSSMSLNPTAAPPAETFVEALEDSMRDPIRSTQATEVVGYYGMHRKVTFSKTLPPEKPYWVLFFGGLRPADEPARPRPATDLTSQQRHEAPRDTESTDDINSAALVIDAQAREVYISAPGFWDH